MTSSDEQTRDQQRDTWDRFSVGWRTWDAMVGAWLDPVGAAMLRQAHLRADDRVLDVASGTGEPGLSAAALVPTGRVTVTDLSQRMLAVASENAALRALRNVDALVCEAGALPFEDAGFDAVLCRFGFMFFPNQSEAAAELARVARPGARVVAAVWSDPADNPWATAIMTTIARYVAAPAPPPPAPGLFRCASKGFLSRVFVQAGLREVSEHELSCDMLHDSPEQYWDFMTEVAAPVVAGLATCDEAARGAIRAEVLSRAQASSHDGRVRMRSTATIVSGTR
ncbi:MAG: methyltransferase domain-containing protein [Nocardioidaceae bacterium]